jgi:hypothetical protein
MLIVPRFGFDSYGTNVTKASSSSESRNLI